MCEKSETNAEYCTNLFKSMHLFEWSLGGFKFKFKYFLIVRQIELIPNLHPKLCLTNESFTDHILSQLRLTIYNTHTPKSEDFSMVVVPGFMNRNDNGK